ncbi:MAG: ABC transporter permease [Kiritimatiellae bacterium]|nr:ABC transporter permease [Kiritimatiellia bacterium]MDW8459476.1 hypothetical protein [Verrucomicrobiota bacterium]
MNRLVFRRILAIAAITVRSAVRSKMVVCLLALMAAAVVGLPLTLKGDGTAEGQLRIVLNYSLGAAFGLLALSSLWAGALSISEEIEQKQIHLVAVKPVTCMEIWLGKWLGIMAINTVLLAAAFAATLALLPRDLLDAQSDKRGDWQLVFQPVSPVEENLESAAQALLEERIRSGAYPADVNQQVALRQIRQELLARSSAVAPGRRKDWSFQLDRPIRAAESVRIRFRASPSQLNLSGSEGIWIASVSGATVWQTNVTFIPQSVQVVDVPAGVLAGARELTLSFVNRDSSNQTLIFDPADGIRVLLPAGGFYGNCARAFVMLLTRLAFLSAVGVTSGALFSVPVALFMAVAFLLSVQLAGYTAEFRSDERGVLAVLERTGEILRVALHPLRTPPALDLVATGMLVEGRDLLRVFGVQALAYGGLFAGLGAGILSRRELALPSA